MERRYKYTLFGASIEKSLSPYIYQTFPMSAGVSFEYTKTTAQESDFLSKFKLFIKSGGMGGNITAPLKEQAFVLMDRCSEAARIAKAVNVFVVNQDGKLFGDNTDGRGLVTDLLQNCKVNIEGEDILILGAGGATRGILYPLLQQNPKSITIVNRTKNKAEMILEEVPCCGVPVFIKEYAGLSAETDKFSLIINATSMGFTGKVPPIDSRLIAGATCYDLSYHKEYLAFLDFAIRHGAKQTFSGIGMLVEQASLNFDLWFGYLPITKNILSALQKSGDHIEMTKPIIRSRL